VKIDPYHIGGLAHKRSNPRKIIRDYQEKTQFEVFIETGTYLGETIESVHKYFDKSYSIELSEKLGARAKNKFLKESSINIYVGQSEKCLPEILNELNKPAIFWLDAHYSEGFTAKGPTDTAILSELDAIKSHSIKNHVILIDDMRSFRTEAYPDIDEVEKILLEINSDYEIFIEDDIMHSFLK